MQEMAPRFLKFSGGACPDPLANSLASLGQSLAALGRAPRIITLQSIFKTWQACCLELIFMAPKVFKRLKFDCFAHGLMITLPSSRYD